MLNYKDFLQQKQIEDPGNGFNLPKSELNPMLFEFQKDITLWSLRKGRTLIGLNCGLGKGPIQLEWLKQVCRHANKPVIMFAPPGVKTQFKYEAKKFGYEVKIIAEDSDIVNGINITNYERLMIRERVPLADWNTHCQKHEAFKPVELKRDDFEVYTERFRFDPGQFSGIALDEGSILKHYGAKTRDRLTSFAKNIPFRIIGTATPAPNDYMELINYAHFLGIMNGKQVRAIFFIQDGNSSNKFRIQRPAWEKWWKFVASWAVMIRFPSDLGYQDDGFILPEMEMHQHSIKDANIPDGMLFPVTAKSLSEQSKVKRNSVEERCKEAAKIANNNDEHYIVWCERNDESALLKKLIPDAIEVTGSHTEQYKEDAFVQFAQGQHRVIITKPSMGGLGMNWQVCPNQVFTSIDHSHEKQYQAIRRSWRFGQENPVNIHLISMDTEGDIMANIKRKEKQADVMFKEISKKMDVHELYNQNGKVKKEEMDYKVETHTEEYWTLMLGDSAQRIQELEDQSVGVVVTSVPFPAMYSYTNSPLDIGNYNESAPLVEHLGYVFRALLPKMMPGRCVDIHLAQGVAHLNREGYIGMWDFRGPLIEMMRQAGFVWDGEWTIEKDPRTERARSNTLGLSQKTLMNNPVMMRPSVADYVLKFRAPGKNPKPFNALLADPEIHGDYVSPDGWITLDMWVNWASNVWYKYRKDMKWWESISVVNVLGAKRGDKKLGFGVAEGKGKDDERHLCELQLDVIERLIALHSAPGELVVDPFNGIGSTGYQALKMGRQYTGIELKDTYYYTAIKNLRWIEDEIKHRKFDLFSLMDIKVEQDELMARHKGWMNERGISLQDRATNWSDWEKETI
jgi:hypothetical protein